MPTSIILLSTAAMAGLGATFGAVLSIASKRLFVPVDPRIESVKDALPNAGCGACGCPGCMAFARAVVNGEASPADCIPGGEEVANRVAGILGVSVEAREPMVARVSCAGERSVQGLGLYRGFHDCNAAMTIAGGATSCQYSCLGLGSCVKSCLFGALSINAQTGLPIVDESLCTGCGVCVSACPRGVLEVLPQKQTILAQCHNPERGPAVKKACALGCIGCGLCVKACNTEVDGEKAIRMEGTLPVINSNLCEQCEKCVEKCPTGSLVILKSGCQARRLSIIAP
jgi:H+/Na+-translocating ferredoxin:NAD+ oxidoreductase subunit B